MSSIETRPGLALAPAHPAPTGWTSATASASCPWKAGTGTPDGRPSELTLRRWQRFGLSGAKLIWGGEAVAVRPDGRANPNQLMINARDPGRDLAGLRQALVEAHVAAHGSAEGLVIGLQLTHSGRYARPNRQDKPRAAPRLRPPAAQPAHRACRSHPAA